MEKIIGLRVSVKLDVHAERA